MKLNNEKQYQTIYFNHSLDWWYLDLLEGSGKSEKLELWKGSLQQKSEMECLQPVKKPNLPSPGDSDFPRHLRREKNTEASITSHQKDA